jgi:hypothetical protein
MTWLKGNKMREQEVNWKGKMLVVQFEVYPAEPDVGIMGPYPEVSSIKDEDGKELGPLSIDEEAAIADLIVIEEGE